MAVKRIVMNAATDRLDAAKALHGDVRGMTVGMDHGWTITRVGNGETTLQVGFASEGGSARRFPIRRPKSTTWLPRTGG